MCQEAPVRTVRPEGHGQHFQGGRVGRVPAQEPLWLPSFPAPTVTGSLASRSWNARDLGGP